MRARLRARGEVDIERNYHPDVLLIRGGLLYRGHEGVRLGAAALAREIGDAKAKIGDAKASYDTVLVAGELAFLEWSVHTSEVAIDDRVDTFLIRDGRIVAKTVHYTVRRPAAALGARANGKRRSRQRVASGQAQPAIAATGAAAQDRCPQVNPAKGVAGGGHELPACVGYAPIGDRLRKPAAAAGSARS